MPVSDAGPMLTIRSSISLALYFQRIRAPIARSQEPKSYPGILNRFTDPPDFGPAYVLDILSDSADQDPIQVRPSPSPLDLLH